jgi:hypothetical protein
MVLVLLGQTCCFSFVSAIGAEETGEETEDRPQSQSGCRQALRGELPALGSAGGAPLPESYGRVLRWGMIDAKARVGAQSISRNEIRDRYLKIKESHLAGIYDVRSLPTLKQRQILAWLGWQRGLAQRVAVSTEQNRLGQIVNLSDKVLKTQLVNTLHARGWIEILPEGKADQIKELLKDSKQKGKRLPDFEVLLSEKGRTLIEHLPPLRDFKTSLYELGFSQKNHRGSVRSFSPASVMVLTALYLSDTEAGQSGRRELRWYDLRDITQDWISESTLLNWVIKNGHPTFLQHAKHPTTNDEIFALTEAGRKLVEFYWKLDRDYLSQVSSGMTNLMNETD